MLRVVGPLALGLAVVAPAAAQTTPIFRMDCGASWPNCGFAYTYTEHEGQLYRRTRLAGQAPSGRDAVRMTFLPGSGQFEWGWLWVPRDAVGQGNTRYLRWRFRIVSPVRWRASNGNNVGGKLVILGNLCEKSPYSPTRVISNIEGRSDGAFLRTEHNISGPPSRTDVASLAHDTWHSVQMEVRSSSTSSQSNGLLRMFLNAANASPSSPTGQSSGGFALRTDGWATAGGCADSNLAFGNTFNAMASGENAVLDVADFEYDDQFDPNWNRGGSSGGTTITPPQGVHIITASAFGLLPLSALTMLLRGLRRRSGGRQADRG
jgi:hypothetical protein